MYITQLLQIHNQIRILHWQTSSYAEHKALGNLYKDMDDLIDNFVEARSGQYGISKAKNNFSISMENIEKCNPKKCLEEGISVIKQIYKSISEEDTELKNILDEMIAAMRKTRYLLELK
jgi:hypothetical protein